MIDNSVCLKKIIVFFGPPGSGKGTVAKRCVEEYGWGHLSTGALCRIYAKKNDVLGKRIASLIDAGILVSDDLIIELLEKEIKEQILEKKEIILLDGFPRTVSQVILFKKMFDGIMQKVKCVFLIFELLDDIAFTRINKRVVCSNSQCEAIYNDDEAEKIEKKCLHCASFLIKRNDDVGEIIKNRLSFYRMNIHGIIDFLNKNNMMYLFFKADGPKNVMVENFFSLLKTVSDAE